ncbi:MAG: hypothetical protein ABW252_20455 [Polyangiales bacterium]
MIRSHSSAPASRAPRAHCVLALCAALIGALCSIGATARAEGVQCYVYDDGYTNLAGPSDAVYFNGPWSACIPDGTASGTCRKWFGMCTTTITHQRVLFRTFNDGYTSQSIAHDSVYVPSTNQACIPDGTGTGTCRRWFGRATTTDGQPVRCQLFGDGYSDTTGITDAIYFRASGSVCLPDGTASGTCRKWFGRCATL